ncbi:MAG: HD domain-containing phosphohydrolase [Vampirovibrionales bacterium]|nr:HD domain-containing phosphohydrolase [Vampirovibrionales bacterium]
MNSAMDAINKGGAHRYLAKPWDDEILRQAIYEGVEQYRLAQENFRLKVSLEKKNEALVQLSRTMERKVVERTQDLGSLNERLQSELKGVIQLLLKLEESHSVTVFGHSNRVFEWSTRVGEALGLSEEMRYQLGVAAQLHDIGKIGLPLALLSKPMMVMSPYEKSVYQSHAARGADWLAQIPQFKLSASVVRYHHELMDGSGFPEGRVGKEIPLGARILCAVDALDQWLQTQPVLDAEAVREGLRVLEADRNLLYDGEILDALRQVTNVYMPLNPVIQEVAPSAIQEGMILARDLVTSQGMLVLKQGSVITPYNYDKVVSLLRKQTPLDGVYVYQPVNLKV